MTTKTTTTTMSPDSVGRVHGKKEKSAAAMAMPTSGSGAAGADGETGREAPRGTTMM